MSRTSIPVDSETKDRLDDLKRDSETWDEFLTRIASDEEPIEAGAWSDEEAETAMERLREGRNRPE
jgi:lipase chaperone LimK